MRFAVLASGSKANCTFIESGRTRFLVDCGLSAKETARRLAALGVEASAIDGILVTHDHRDHTAGISVFSRKYRIPVYTNLATSERIGEIYGHEEFTTGSDFSLGNFQVHPFPVTHDAEDPVGFSILAEGAKFVYATDLGRVTGVVREAVRGCNALVLEFNHDQDLLWKCEYPWVLKQRIASSHGHLCNDHAAALVKELFHPAFSHLVLGHISENSNTPQTAMSSLSSAIDPSRLAACLCADPYRSTPMMQVDGGAPARAAEISV